MLRWGEERGKIYFYWKKTKQCKQGNCGGKLNVVKLVTRKKSNGYPIIENNEKILHVKQCDKCGCYYMHVSQYTLFQSYECQKNIDIINSKAQIEEFTEQWRKKVSRGKTIGNVTFKGGVEPRPVTRTATWSPSKYRRKKINLNFDEKTDWGLGEKGKMGNCIKCGMPEYRIGLGYCWECYKEQKTGY